MTDPKALQPGVLLPDPGTIPGDDLLDLAASFGGWWGECPLCPKEDWTYAIAAGDTLLGYWQWVAERLNNIQDSDL